MPSNYSYIGLSATMIKFMSLEFLGLSHRIPGKIKNAIYGFKISALVLEILKFEKCVKYANEGTDDIIYSIKYNINNINRDLGLSLVETIET